MDTMTPRDFPNTTQKEKPALTALEQYLRKITFQNVKSLYRRFEKKHGQLPATVALILWGWMLVYSFTSFEPQYVSQAIVLIKDSAITSRYIIPEQGNAMQTTSSNSSNPVLNTMGLLKSESISIALWDFFRTKHPEELKHLKIKNKNQWESFFGNGKAFVKAKNEAGTDLITVQFSWSKPQVAKEGMEIVLKAFHRASLELNKNEQRSRSEYLVNQVQQIENQLKALRSTKSEYKAKMGTVNIGRESDNLASSGIQLTTELNNIDSKARGKEAETLRFQKMLNLSPESAVRASAIGLNPALQRLNGELYQLSQTHAMLKTTLTDKNPKVKEVRAQMEQVESNIKAELNRTLGKNANDKNPLIVADSTRTAIISQMVEAQAEALRLKTEASVIHERLGQIDQQIKNFPTLEEQLNNMEDEERSLSNALYTLRQKQLEAQMKEAETLSNVFIVDFPRLPKQAKFPNQSQLLVFSFVMGLVGAVAVIFSRRAMQDFNIQELLGNAGLVDTAPLSVQPVKEPVTLKKVRRTALEDEIDTDLDFLFAQNLEVSRQRLEEKIRNQRLKERLYKALLSEKEKSQTLAAQNGALKANLSTPIGYHNSAVAVAVAPIQEAVSLEDIALVSQPIQNQRINLPTPKALQPIEQEAIGMVIFRDYNSQQEDTVIAQPVAEETVAQTDIVEEPKKSRKSRSSKSVEETSAPKKAKSSRKQETVAESSGSVVTAKATKAKKSASKRKSKKA